MTSIEPRYSILTSAAPQAIAVILAVFLSAALHYQNDGLWYQGDAPRNVVNGLFFSDLLTTLPTDPVSYALSYYARYPVITPVAYPPGFYVLEAAGFWMFGPSPYVGKGIVLAFAVLAGLYAMAWGRRWIGPTAGWAGVCVVLAPGFVLLSNAVLLNVPATAIGLAALYHFRVWLETSATRQLLRFCVLAALTVLVYYPGALIIPIAIVWLVASRRTQPRALWVMGGVFAILAVAVGAAVPIYLERHAPSIFLLFGFARWIDFVHRASRMTGVVWLLLGLAGLIIAFATRRLRGEQSRLGSAAGCVIVCLVALRFMDPRYGLILTPLTVLSAFLGIEVAAERFAAWQGALRRVGVGALVTFAIWLAVVTPVPMVSGIEQVSEYLRQHGSSDAVMYSGRYDGVFGAYLRAGDPLFERRLVLWRKQFIGRDRNARAMTPPEIVTLVKSETACQWVAIEGYLGKPISFLDQTLRDALRGPEFEFVRSFPVTAPGISSVDLYRFKSTVDPPPAMDLKFVGFSGRVFRGVLPIPTRRVERDSSLR